MGFQYHNNNLFINGQPVIVAGGAGHAISQELCWVQVGTARVVQPFINTAKAEDLSHVCTGITLNGMPLAHQQSYCRVSSGNETSMGGVKTNTIMGRMFFTSGERSVTLDGHPAVCHGVSIISNEGNCDPSTWVQPQSCPLPYELKTQSSPQETLTHPAILNIEIRGKGPLPRLFVARHLETGHETFAPLTSSLSFLRAGLYFVAELVMTLSQDAMEVSYGVARTRMPKDPRPSLVIQPIIFHAPKNHYIYLFKDGMLWREFLSLGPRGLCETRLEDQAGPDRRVSLGCIHQGIGLPLEDDTGTHSFHYAASPVQWSWEYIHTVRSQRLTAITVKDAEITPDDPYTALNTMISYAIADMQRYWAYQDYRAETQALYQQAQADYAEKIIIHIEACDRAGLWHDYDALHQAALGQMMARVGLALSLSRQGQQYLVDALTNPSHIIHQREITSCCLPTKPVHDSDV